VIYGPNGVDLSEFNCVVRGITRPLCVFVIFAAVTFNKIMCVCNCNCDLAFVYSLLYSLCMFLIYVSYLICHADMAQTPELLDASTDVRYRSYLAAVEG
jgi:hypothetical protein